MFNIDRNNLETIAKSAGAKSTDASTNTHLFDKFKLKIWNIIDTVGTFKVNEMGYWITNMDRWLHNRTYEHTGTYKRRDIVNVDLGATNFRYEPSFVHPCVVLLERRHSLLVVPCSSKKYGKGFPEIIDATSADGFAEPTGIQMESLRWIHKNRVISKVGQASVGVMNKIDDYLIEIIPNARKLASIIKKASDTINLKERAVNEKNKEIESLKRELQNAKNLHSNDVDKINTLLGVITVIKKQIHDKGLESEFSQLFKDVEGF